MHKLFHWFTGCWHQDGEINIPIPGCTEGKTYKRDVRHCCRCGEIQFYIYEQYGS